MTSERWLPLSISRSPRSFFDPSWEVGTDWEDFSHPRDFNRGLNRSSNQHRMERKMEQMEHDMDRMSTNLYQLAPYSRDALKPRSPMNRRHLRLHGSETTRISTAADGGDATRISTGAGGASSSLLSPLALRAAEQVTFEHPVVVDKSGVKKLELNFDVRAFKPDEIQVKTRDALLEVHAMHEEKSDAGLVKREYHRVFSIPPNTEIHAMTSTLSPEGVLSIEAPMRNQHALTNTQQTSIAISHE